jgi:hypothetical protein
MAPRLSVTVIRIFGLFPRFITMPLISLFFVAEIFKIVDGMRRIQSFFFANLTGSHRIFFRGMMPRRAGITLPEQIAVRIQTWTLFTAIQHGSLPPKHQSLY